MTDEIAKTSEANETAMRSIADAISEAGPKAIEALSQMFYTGSYVLAYGVVYAAVFVAQSLPQDDPIMRGLCDGGQEAVDKLDAA